VNVSSTIPGVPREKVSAHQQTPTPGTYLRTHPEMTMIDLNNDDATARVAELTPRPALPSFQRSELPRRLRGEWPEPAPASDNPAPTAAEITRVDPTEYWQRLRAE
jgi:hypothetical protein